MIMYRLTLFTFVLATLAYFVAAHADDAAPVPAAYQLMQTDVEAAAAAALVAKGAGPHIRAELSGVRSPVIYQAGKPLTPRITGLSFDKASNHWTGNLLVASGDQVLTAMPVSGRYDEIVQRAVVKRQVRNGETISEADIDTMEFPVSLTRSDEVADPQKLLGLSPRTVLSPKRPIRFSEVAPPALVHKNNIVTMRYDTGTMEITTNGQAVSEGGKGDVIEVRNLTSKAIVRGTVEDAHTVNVNLSAPQRELAGVPYAPAN